CFAVVVVRAPRVLALPWTVSLALAAPMTCHVMLQFPVGELRLSLKQRLLIYLIPLLLALVLSLDYLFFHFSRPAAVVAVVLAAIYLIVGTVARVRRMRRRRSEIDPAAARWVQLAGVVEAAPIVGGAAWAAVDARS